MKRLVKANKVITETELNKMINEQNRFFGDYYIIINKSKNKVNLDIKQVVPITINDLPDNLYELYPISDFVKKINEEYKDYDYIEGK